MTIVNLIYDFHLYILSKDQTEVQYASTQQEEE